MNCRFVALLALAICCAPHPASAAPPAGLASLDAQAEALYQAAAAYTAHGPVTIAQSETTLDPQSPFMKFMAAEKQFEVSIGQAERSGALPPPRPIEWIQIGQWVGSAVFAVGQYCNPSEARLDLSVARQYIDDARAGSPLFIAPHSNWQPSGIDDARKQYMNQVQRCRR